MRTTGALDDVTAAGARVLQSIKMVMAKKNAKRRRLQRIKIVTKPLLLREQSA